MGVDGASKPAPSPDHWHIRIGQATHGTRDRPPHLRRIIHVTSNCNDLALVHGDLDEERVVPHIVALLEHLVRHEPWEAEPECVGLTAGPLEVLPGRVRHEALHDVARLLWDGRLVEQCEGHGVREGPRQQRVVFPGEELDVDGEVARLPRPVSVEEEGGHEAVAVGAGAEGWAADLKAPVLGLGIGHFVAVVRDLPQQCARGVGRKAMEGTAQGGDLLLLPGDKAAQEAQVVLAALVKVLVQGKLGTLQVGGRGNG